MANFEENLEEQISHCQITLDSAASRDRGGDSDSQKFFKSRANHLYQ